MRHNLVRYEAYKDSGVKWLRDIPKHWGVVRVKDIVNKIGNGVTPRGGSEVYTDQGIPFLRSQNVYDDGLRIEEVSFIPERIHSEMKGSQLRAEDILINITGASIGRTCVVPVELGDANINQHIAFMRSKYSVNNTYVSILLKSPLIKEYIQFNQNGASKEAFNLSQIASIPIIFPKPAEQKEIAEYLSTKTAQIDRKIDLLTQKANQYGKLKQTLINKTVTRGLDKTVAMKDSGIEWIGEVPKNWEIFRCKDLVDYYNYYPIGDGDHGSIKPEMYVEAGIPYIRVQNLSWNGKISLENIAYITEDVHNLNKKSRLLIDDILVAKTGATVGKLGLITVEIKEANTTSSVGKITINKKCFHPRFILYSFMAESFQKQIWITASQKSAQPGFNIDQFIFFTIACPKTKIEQQAIADYLDTKTVHIDRIVETINTQIDKLKELRKTLINDVVTGKIQVVREGAAV